jgi:hypothetical protein
MRFKKCEVKYNKITLKNCSKNEKKLTKIEIESIGKKL